MNAGRFALPSIIAIVVTALGLASPARADVLATTEHFVVRSFASDIKNELITKDDAQFTADLFENAYAKYVGSTGLGLKPPRFCEFEANKRIRLQIHDWAKSRAEHPELRIEDPEKVTASTKSTLGIIDLQLQHWGRQRRTQTPIYNDDYLQYLAAHELFHAIQGAYVADAFAEGLLGKRYEWLTDATAEWATLEAFPNLDKTPLMANQNEFLAHPYLPIHRNAKNVPGANRYGTAVFFRFLSNSSNNLGGAALIPRLMEAWALELQSFRMAAPSGRITNYDPLAVVRAALNVSDARFREIYDDFASAGVLGRAADKQWLADVDRLTVADPTRIHLTKSILEFSSGKPLGYGGFQSYAIVVPMEKRGGAEPALYVDVPSPEDQLSVQGIRLGGRSVTIEKAAYDPARKRYRLRIHKVSELVVDGTATLALVVTNYHNAPSERRHIFVTLGDPPFLKSATVTQGGETKFSATWKVNSDTTRVREGGAPKSLKSGEAATVHLAFSAPVGRAACKLDDASVSELATTDGGITWSGTVAGTKIKGTKHELRVRAEATLAGTPFTLALDTDPTTIAAPHNGAWEKYERNPAEMVIRLGGGVIDYAALIRETAEEIGWKDVKVEKVFGHYSYDSPIRGTPAGGLAITTNSKFAKGLRADYETVFSKDRLETITVPGADEALLYDATIRIDGKRVLPLVYMANARVGGLLVVANCSDSSDSRAKAIRYLELLVKRIREAE